MTNCLFDRQVLRPVLNGCLSRPNGGCGASEKHWGYRGGNLIDLLSFELLCSPFLLYPMLNAINAIPLKA